MRGQWLAAVGAVALSAQVLAQAPRPDQAAFRDLYKELVETNTTLSAGSCTVAAEKMAARLTAAGYPAADVRILTPAENPRFGNLAAVLPGTSKKLKPVLLLAHIDVVEANRADWERDPFTLVEEDGYFYARGASDDKAMASVFVDSMVRYKQAGYKPARTIKLALTCGEETPGTFDGARWLVQNHRDAVDAAFALNEGAGGRLDDAGKPVSLGIQAGEKVYQDFELTVTNKGGHSSAPVKDNAITALSAALVRIGAYDFPVSVNAATKGFFGKSAALTPGAISTDMKAIGAGTADAAAYARISTSSASWNSMLRTTCVPTMVSAGHAPNALPQRATGNVNCRILPGVDIESVRAELTQVANDPRVSVKATGAPGTQTVPPALTPEITGPAEKAAAKIWPGVPLVPAMSTGATDGRFLNAAGIPTYGLSGMFSNAEGTHAHGLNERIRVRSLYEGRDFLYDVVKLYAGGR